MIRKTAEGLIHLELWDVIIDIPRVQDFVYFVRSILISINSQPFIVQIFTHFARQIRAQLHYEITIPRGLFFTR